MPSTPVVKLEEVEQHPIDVLHNIDSEGKPSILFSVAETNQKIAKGLVAAAIFNEPTVAPNLEGVAS